jgi:hypothetical protein
LADGDGGAFEGVGGLAVAGGVDEDRGEAGDVGEFGDVVASGAGDLGGDGARSGEEEIGEGGFADVGLAYDGDLGGVKETPEGLVLQDERGVQRFIFEGLVPEGGLV